MMHPDTEIQFINKEIGYGVVAKKLIPKGTITWALDKLDRVFSPDQIKAFPKEYQDIFDTYCFRNSNGEYVLCWDISRFVNHSFKSNCLTTAYDFEIAIRDIQPGEQLTDDYGYLNIDSPFEAASEGTDRKVVYPDDLTRCYKAWDKQLDEAVRFSTSVDQPLKYLIADRHWKEIQEAASGSKAMKSILDCYFDRSNHKVKA